MNFNPIVFPLDTYESAAELFFDATRVLIEPGMSDLVGMLKINDGVHMPDMSGPMVVRGIHMIGRKLKINLGAFLDLKINDVHGTLQNVLVHYQDDPPDVITVSENTSAQGFLTLLQGLPETELALFDVATDIPEEECLLRWGMKPAEKIFHDICKIEEVYQRVRGANDPELPFHLVVSSPRELDFLHDNGVMEKYGSVTPGIRDDWMLKEQQKRSTGVRYALDKGSRYVVMGSQLRKGNPKKGISPEESRRLTAEEIKKSDIFNLRVTKGVRSILRR